ncbi:hypothetical protein EDB81DRAFT_870253 [Dactylonectria macrodidyma]|uniref:Zn(2)-C6 fungal-type domain-containing protein n=1 Tax=Dactylonectria macrodidyma TaxID=307937 RepID=A0A9P9ENT9_9HYPO|nr:hypothetical protein EDB81DRAFT_870253 [Dactylonectria macrodidyma]
MVNKGRPSKDCLPCRKRKLQCDLKLESCGQCQRANISCHGYRNLQDLAFRDETHVAKHKVLTRLGRNPPAASAVSLPISHLELNMGTRCRETFFLLYVTGLSRSCTSLVPLYAQASANGHLACSVDAVSLAFTAVQTESQEVMRLANKRYVTAIQGLGKALRDCQAMKSDETLQSVLLLDAYEKLSSREAHRPPSWMSHIQGAMSLIEARGTVNFSNPIARQLVRTVVKTLTITCGAAKVSVPESILWLRRELDVFNTDIKWDFMGILSDIVNLRADVHHNRGGGGIWAIEKAKGIDQSLASLEQKLEEFSKPVPVVATISTWPGLLDGQYDVYPNHYATQVWNTLRTMRLEMNDIITNDPRGSETGAFETIKRISRQICHAVPQFILPGARPENTEPFSPMQKLQCRVLLAPLYLSAQLSTDRHMREWICSSMDYMAEKGNMRVAKDVADLLRTRSDADSWTVWAMTGCYAMAA